MKINKISYSTVIRKITYDCLKMKFCEKINNTKEKNYNPEILDREAKKIKLMDYLPNKAQEYLRLGRYDRPVGYMLLFWPCAWGLTLGAPEINLLYYKTLALFFSGSVLMRSSGCIINDMWDKDIDSKVARSQGRPMAANKISYKQASLFLAAHLAVSLGILLQLPKYSIIAGLGIMPIVCIYPYMKRVTYFPQFFLGLAYNSGVIVGLPSMTGMVSLPVLLPLYTAGVLWTLIYDTIYAHMDKTDDVKINVKSTALYFDESTKLALTIMTIIMMYLIYTAIKNSTKETEDAQVTKSHIFLVLAALFQFYSIYKVNLNSPLSCLKHFKANSFFGLLIFLSALFAHLDQYNKQNKQ